MVRICVRIRLINRILNRCKSILQINVSFLNIILSMFSHLCCIGCDADWRSKTVDISLTLSTSIAIKFLFVGKIDIVVGFKLLGLH